MRSWLSQRFCLSNRRHNFNCYHRIDTCNYSVLSFCEVFQNKFYRNEDTVKMLAAAYLNERHVEKETFQVKGFRSLINFKASLLFNVDLLFVSHHGSYCTSAVLI